MIIYSKYKFEVRGFMLYNQMGEMKLSALGFGAMRLPEKDGKVDKELVTKMVSYAMENGVNYFDTAWPYHAGMSERIMGEVLSQYPRGSYFLADKYPVHQIMADYNPAKIFEEQLRRCRTDYFDFYLKYSHRLHNTLTVDHCFQRPIYCLGVYDRQYIR